MTNWDAGTIKKSFLLWLFGVILLSVGCERNELPIRNTGASAVTSPTPPVFDEMSDQEIKRLIINCGCRTDDESLLKIKSLPRDRIIQVLQQSKQLSPRKVHDIDTRSLRLKSAFLLSQLGVDDPANTQIVVDEARKSANRGAHLRIEAVGFVGEYIKQGKKNLLPLVFRASEDSDAGLTQEIESIFKHELLNSTREFLELLQLEPSHRQRATVNRIRQIRDDETNSLTRIKDQIRMLSAEEKYRIISNELLSAMEPFSS